MICFFDRGQATRGNDNVKSKWNVFSSKCLELVVDMSAAAKAAGYLVTASICLVNVLCFFLRDPCDCDPYKVLLKAPVP